MLQMKEQKAITLITLVITIIVMLVLVRGGQMFNESRAGVFSVGSSTTSLYSYYTGFRVALVCE